MRRRWISLCQYMNYKFPQNEVFPKYEEVAQVPKFAIIKRSPPVTQGPPVMCDRCPARAKWLVKVNDTLSLALCGHHREEHAPHIAANGYAEELLPIPASQS